jgi:ABC-type glutathione transport system ATPase component
MSTGLDSQQIAADKAVQTVGPVISVEHVRLDYKKEKEHLLVLDDVSLEACKDEFVTIT